MIDSVLSFLPLILVALIASLIWVTVRRRGRNVQVLPQLPVVLPTPEYKGPFAFFRRHFHGDYSLGRSYWVNTFLISLFAPVVGLMLAPWLSEFPARYGSAAFLLITTLWVVAWFWAVGGTWASANKHVQRGGKSGWATAAKVMIIFAFARTFIDLVGLMPSLEEHVRVAAGAQLGPSTKLELRADGRSILLSGGINDGSAEQLEKALDMAPSVRTVEFSSHGGWIREGEMLAAVIRKRQLNTYVEGYCASACTIAFLAGKERAAAPTAKIGFHASRGVGSVGSRASADEVSQLRSLYLTAGLPDIFVRRVLDTPHDSIWHPPHEMLLAAGVLTRGSMGGETAALSTSVRSKDMLAAELGKVETFALLAQRSPRDFDNLIEAAWDKLQRGATDAEVMTATRVQLATIMPRFVLLASEETLVAFQALAQEQLEALRERSLTACVEMAFPSGSVNIAGILPLDLTKRELLLMTKALQEADSARRIKPSQEAVEGVVHRAAVGMTQEQREVFADESVRRQASPARTCEAAIRFVNGLNSIPMAERGSALRVLYSAQ